MKINIHMMIVRFAFVFAAVCVSLGYGATIISDNFSDNEVFTPTFSTNGTKWVIDSGSFAADGSSVGNLRPTTGELNFGVDPHTKIHIDYGSVAEGAPSTIEFRLRQSNGAELTNYRFDLLVEDTSASNFVYDIAMSLNPAFFDTSGFALNPDDRKRKPVVGSADASLNNSPSVIQLTFDPTNGLTLKQNGATVLSFANSLGLKKINRMSLESHTGAVSWFVSDVKIDATLEAKQSMNRGEDLPAGARHNGR